MMRHKVIFANCFLVGIAWLAACSSNQEAAKDMADTATVADQAANQGAVPDTSQPVAHDTASISAAGVKVFIDPVTGEIRDPTPAEAAALAAEAAKQKAAHGADKQNAPRQIVHPDGTVEVIIDESADQSLQGCVQKDGSIVMAHDCAQHQKTSPEKLK